MSLRREFSTLLLSQSKNYGYYNLMMKSRNLNITRENFQMSPHPPESPNNNKNFSQTYLRYERLLKKFWIKIENSVYITRHGFQIYFQEARIVTNLLCRYNSERFPSNSIEMLLIKNFCIQSSKTIPFLIIMAIPGGEFIIPPLMYFFPNIMPSYFDTLFKSLDVSVISKLSGCNRLLSYNIEESNFQTLNSASLPSLTYKEIFSKGLEIKTQYFTDILRYFDLETIFEVLTTKSLMAFSHIMQFESSSCRQDIIARITEKCQLLNADDIVLSSDFNTNFEKFTNEQLIDKCQERGISCNSSERTELVHYLKIWIGNFLHPRPVSYPINFLTRILYHDQGSTLKTIINSDPDFIKKAEILIEWNPEFKQTLEYSRLYNMLDLILGNQQNA